MQQAKPLFESPQARRAFLQRMGLTALTLPSLSLYNCAGSSADSNGESTDSTTQTAAGQTIKKLGIALVGLGKYSEGQLGPALQETQYCRLTGIVTGTPNKAKTWKQTYNIPDKNIYTYQTFDQIATNPAIDIVYVVLPNALHADFVVRAAKAGKHVICEKPMATTTADARRMIAACKAAGKQLSVGYRLHVEPHNQNMMELGQRQLFGPVRHLVAENGQKEGYDTPWRLNKALAGGGPLPDVGIYCLQGSLYTKGQLPVSVTARFHPITDREKFTEVEEGMTFQLQFADGTVADCRTSYNDTYNKLRAEAAKGWFELEPAYGYGGIRGKTSRGNMKLDNVNQQARQMDAFAQCVLNGTPTTLPGELGLRDVQLIEAIYEAARTGKKVATRHIQPVVDQQYIRQYARL
ncbi:oxidoreductase domain protein [Fibrella aestuarina BUZ 2]|uniref:Oxidoreductase domain protein n=1 Tax=Fibrella aestuarina BUZ 2 TaxID=1166018 RepID=I0K9X2_9BACT|nr:Gfo/Idh/MocA family oxidoreductase [Fibrella aestuarina]CCH00925.1 oxidoreductase domain protein [Fibrella aestuarina BUZ 2]